MSANVIFGVDFKKANPKADRAFWIGPDREAILAADRKAVEIANVALVGDTAPSEYTAPTDDCA